MHVNWPKFCNPFPSWSSAAPVTLIFQLFCVSENPPKFKCSKTNIISKATLSQLMNMESSFYTEWMAAGSHSHKLNKTGVFNEHNQNILVYINMQICRKRGNWMMNALNLLRRLIQAQ